MTRGRRRPQGAYQGSASDPASVKRADRLVKERERQEKIDLAEVMGLPSGRRVLWRILEECKLLEQVWDPSVRVHFLLGRQDIGHFLLAQILGVSEEMWIQMQQEELLRARREAVTVEAMNTDSALMETDDAID